MHGDALAVRSMIVPRNVLDLILHLPATRTTCTCITGRSWPIGSTIESRARANGICRARSGVRAGAFQPPNLPFTACHNVQRAKICVWGMTASASCRGQGLLRGPVRSRLGHHGGMSCWCMGTRSHVRSKFMIVPRNVLNLISGKTCPLQCATSTGFTRNDGEMRVQHLSARRFNAPCRL